MLRNVNGHIFLDVASDLCSSFLCDETSKTSDIDILSGGERVFYFLEHCFKCNKHVHFRNTCFFGNLINQIGLSPGGGFAFTMPIYDKIM